MWAAKHAFKSVTQFELFFLVYLVLFYKTLKWVETILNFQS